MCLFVRLVVNAIAIEKTSAFRRDRPLEKAMRYTGTTIAGQVIVNRVRSEGSCVYTPAGTRRKSGNVIRRGGNGGATKRQRCIEVRRRSSLLNAEKITKNATVSCSHSYELRVVERRAARCGGYYLYNLRRFGPRLSTQHRTRGPGRRRRREGTRPNRSFTL